LADVSPIIPAGRQVIETYGEMRFRISGAAYEQAVIVLPDLVMPWAPEDGVQRLDWAACGLDAPPRPEDPAGVEDCPGAFGGGISLYDISDPCTPVKVGEGWSPWMRESHSLGFQRLGDRDYMAVDFLDYDGSGGVGIWDLTDVTAPVFVSWIRVPNHIYPDSYLSLTLSVFWQGDRIYAATAGRGTYVIDASDPLNLQLIDMDPSTEAVDSISLPRPQHAGTFHVWGNRGLVSAAGVPLNGLFNLEDPDDPQLVFGGAFTPSSPDGTPAPYYFANIGQYWGLFARSDDAGGPVIYDLREGESPRFVTELVAPEGDGGYIFQHEDHLFQGESNYGAIYAFDGTTVEETARFDLKGDLDTVTPMGNVMFVSVDAGADPGQATVVMPWQTEPDTRPPEAGMHSPLAGETGVHVRGRVGLAFNEMMEPRSAHRGAFRVFSEGGVVVEGHLQVQENLVNFSPLAPLDPGTRYHVWLPAGGLADVSGNALADDVRFTFTTEGEEVLP